MSQKAVIFCRNLVIFAIFVSIAAILLPVFMKAKEGRPHSCSSNMKILGLALIQYVQDNDEMMPNTENGSPGTTWRTVIMPYLKDSQRFRCPDRLSNDSDANPIGPDGFTANFSVNNAKQGAFGGPSAKPVALAEVSEPEKLIALMETSYNPYPEYDIDDALRFGPASRRFWAGHWDGTSNYLFLDGHVKALAPDSTYQTFWPGKVAVNYWYRDDKKPLSVNGSAVLQDAEQRFPQTETP